MILAPSQGSTQKGTEQWDVIVLKSAQQEALLQHSQAPGFPGIGRINGVQLSLTVYQQPSVSLAACPPLSSF